MPPTPNNTFERYAFLVKGSHKISDRVDVAASVSFANSKPRNAARAVGEYFYQGLTHYMMLSTIVIKYLK